MITCAGDDGKEPDEGDIDGKAAMIARAGDDGKEPDEDDIDGKAAMIASAGDDGEEPDLKARSVATTSSLHTYHTDDDVDDLGTDDVNDLVGKLIKKAMEVKSKKSSKRGGKATSNALRLSNRPRGKGDIDKECSCGCGRKPCDQKCPGCGSVNCKITMACWMKGQVCQMCQSKDQRKTVV